MNNKKEKVEECVTFHPNHGRGVLMSTTNTVALCALNNLETIIFGHKPLRSGIEYEIEVSGFDMDGGIIMKAGCIAQDPASINFSYYSHMVLEKWTGTVVSKSCNEDNSDLTRLDIARNAADNTIVVSANHANKDYMIRFIDPRMRVAVIMFEDAKGGANCFMKVNGVYSPFDCPAPANELYPVFELEGAIRMSVIQPYPTGLFLMDKFHVVQPIKKKSKKCNDGRQLNKHSSVQVHLNFLSFFFNMIGGQMMEKLKNE